MPSGSLAAKAHESKRSKLAAHREDLPKKFRIIWIRQDVHVGLVIIELPGDTLQTADQQIGYGGMIGGEVQLQCFRRGDTHKLGLGVCTGLMLDDVVHAVERGQEGGQIVPKATEGSFQKTHASPRDQLLAEVIEERVYVDVCKGPAKIR